MRDFLARLAWMNLCLSVWVFMALCFSKIVRISHMPPDEFRFMPTKPYFAPFSALGIEIILWILLFRRENRGARLMAGVWGFWLVISVGIVPLLMADVYQWKINVPLYALSVYAALSHIGYAFLGDEDS
jgi:L-asparagine transporter-like permease